MAINKGGVAMDFLKDMSFEVKTAKLQTVATKSTKDITCLKGLNEKRALYRTDTEQLLGIVSDNYMPIQNKEITSVVIPEAEKFSEKLDGGVISDGRKLYLKFLDKDYKEEIRKKDPIQVGYAVKWGHDGGTAVNISSYFHREICENGMWGISKTVQFRGLHFGDNEERKKIFIQRVAEAFEKIRKEARQSLKTNVKNFKKWSKVKVLEKDAHKIAENVFKLTKTNSQLNQRSETMLEKWNGVYKESEALLAPKDNLWGVYNSLTAVLTHQSGRTPLKSNEKFIYDGRVQNWFKRSLNECNDFAQKAA